MSVESQAYVSRIAHLKQINSPARFISFEPLLGPVGDVNLEGVVWAIVGGESGHGFRPMNATWALQIRDLCRRDGVAFFPKTVGWADTKSRWSDS